MSGNGFSYEKESDQHLASFKNWFLFNPQIFVASLENSVPIFCTMYYVVGSTVKGFLLREFFSISFQIRPPLSGKGLGKGSNFREVSNLDLTVEEEDTTVINIVYATNTYHKATFPTSNKLQNIYYKATLF